MKLSLYFDGLCEPRNPGGMSCYGWLVKDDQGLWAQGWGYVAIGEGSTNNVAEYTALIKGLEALRDLLKIRISKETVQVLVHGDSQLVINQVFGNWSINAEHLQKMVDQVRLLIKETKAANKGMTLEGKWIPRKQNEEADELSRRALGETIEGRFQPGEGVRYRKERDE